MKAPFFSPEDYNSVDEVLLVNEELQIQLSKLKNRFCGCGNCINKDKPCSFLLSKNEAFCPDYVLEEETLDTYEEWWNNKIDRKVLNRVTVWWKMTILALVILTLILIGG